MSTGAEYHEADWVAADPSNFRALARSLSEVRAIVIHVTDGRADPYPVAEMWREPKHGSSAHFVVGQGGRVIQAVRLCDAAFHAHTANRTTVGVEHCARTPKELGLTDPGMMPTRIQYDASARLVAWLCALLGLPPDRKHILGHHEADPKTTHDRCPDGAWDWAVYMPLVRAAYRNLTGRETP